MGLEAPLLVTLALLAALSARFIPNGVNDLGALQL